MALLDNTQKKQSPNSIKILVRELLEVVSRLALYEDLQTLQALKDAIGTLRYRLDTLNKTQTKRSPSSDPLLPNLPVIFPASRQGLPEARHISALVICTTGFISYQIKSLLQRMEASFNISNQPKTAVAMLQNQDFDVVILDLALPTEEEGLQTLDDLKKLCIMGSLNTRLICLSGNVQERTSLEIIAQSHGADHLIFREDGWHKELLDSILAQWMERETQEPFSLEETTSEVLEEEPYYL